MNTNIPPMCFYNFYGYRNQTIDKSKYRSDDQKKY